MLIFEIEELIFGGIIKKFVLRKCCSILINKGGGFVCSFLFWISYIWCFGLYCIVIGINLGGLIGSYIIGKWLKKLRYLFLRSDDKKN